MEVQTGTRTGGSDEKVIIFKLDSEFYAIPVTLSRGIVLVPKKITRVIGSKKAVLGIADIRNKSVPIINFKQQFGLSSNEPGKLVVLICINHGSGEKMFGILVDEVSSVYAIGNQEIQSISSVITTKTNEISGILKVPSKTEEGDFTLVSMLNVEVCLSILEPLPETDPESLPA